MKTVKATLLKKEEIARKLVRLAHEIIENNTDLNNIAIVGIRTRGEILAHRVVEHIQKISGETIFQGTIDVTFYRDDFRTNLGSPKIGSSSILFEVDDKNVILVDDVLYSGRTTRAAMDDLFSLGRPASVQLAVLVDRGHRELPIKADYVGKNYPTSLNEHIHVHVDEVDGEDAVLLMEYGE
jgi:pyrimidine operon attenuation protein/uracil phosphoribosyltransferase|tara:strand:- start:2326 stop:2871 length:546 start_codon:yes stop_codon:yes gene_type:complete